MKPNRIQCALGVALAAVSLVFIPGREVEGCTRAVYIGEDDTVITGRSMDWAEDMQTNLWIFPRGLKRDGAAGPDSPEWTSRYGSVIASGYEIGTADGMNEAGLVANLLYLAEADYGTLDGKPPLSISVWTQYVLDNFATVSETVDALREEPFRLLAPDFPNGKAAQLHLAVSDAGGDSAIFEYIDGKLVIHHGKQFQVMTNSPSYDQQLALNDYWEMIGGLTFLPGTNRAADRFARASFLINAIPRTTDKNYIKAVPDESYDSQAALSVLSVIRSVGVPLGITTPGQPNISSTIWRTVADQKNKVYYFDSATSPNVFWVPLSEIGLE
ncbi:MAG: linear amide C-N hydrolase, partial [Candidatus Erginobacter occultus]|nr:linear amide C-N hydrolase [Candidatus Erginobacter occultus]